MTILGRSLSTVLGMAGILSAQTVSITDSVVQQNYLGAGFNLIQTGVANDSSRWKEVLGKRMIETTTHGYWRAKDPVRIDHYAPSETERTWSSENWTRLAERLQFLKDNDIYVLLTWEWDKSPDWLGGGGLVEDTTLLQKYAEIAAEGMHNLVVTRGLSNIHAWELVNELCTDSGWGSFYYRGQTYQNTHKTIISKVKSEFAKRGLDGVVIRTPGINNADAWIWGTNNHPESSISDMHWYLRSGTWGDINGLSFTENYEWDDPARYSVLKTLFSARVDHARSKGKELAVGEFGGQVIGKPWEAIGESYVGVSEYGAIGDGRFGTFIVDNFMAQLNAGVITSQMWLFVDLIGQWGPYHHGVMADDGRTRSAYYTYGLMTRYIYRGCELYRVHTSDDLIRAVAARNKTTGDWTVAVVNRTASNQNLAFSFASHVPSKPFRKFIYDPTNWQEQFGDLPDHVAKVAVNGGGFTDAVFAGTMALYTTEYDEEAPPVVSGVQPVSASGAVNLTWDESTAPDFRYYRVYGGPTADFGPSKQNQIASTIGTSFSYAPPGSGTMYYKVAAVDKYGNDSERSGSGAVSAIPVALDDRYETASDVTLEAAAPGVMGNDYDYSGAALTVSELTGPKQGALTLNQDGSFAYVPSQGFQGIDTFTYQLSNGGTYDTALVSIMVAYTSPHADGAEACWSFDGHVLDNSGNGYHGAMSGNCSFVDGKAGEAIRIEPGYVETQKSMNLTDQFTVAAFINADSSRFDGWPMIFANAAGGSAPSGLKFHLHQKRIKLETGNGEWGKYAESDTVFTYNTWHHVAVVVDRQGQSAEIYMDGVKVGAGTTHNNFKIDGACRIGAPTNSDDSYKGLIDELRVYTRMLTADEIQALAEIDLTPAKSAVNNHPRISQLKLSGHSLRLQVPWRDHTVEVISMSGRRLFSAVGSESSVYDLARHMSNGTYILRVEAREMRRSVKFAVSK